MENKIAEIRQSLPELKSLNEIDAMLKGDNGPIKQIEKQYNLLCGLLKSKQ